MSYLSFIMLSEDVSAFALDGRDYYYGYRPEVLSYYMGRLIEFPEKRGNGDKFPDIQYQYPAEFFIWDI